MAGACIDRYMANTVFFSTLTLLGMNFEFCSADAYAKGEAMLRSPKQLKEGIACLLEARDLYR